MNIFLLGILFAIVGALCGIFVTKTYSGANFVPVSGCSVVGNSIVPSGGKPLVENFSDADRFAAMFAVVNGTSGVSANITDTPGRLRLIYDNVTTSYDSNPLRGLGTIDLSGDFSLVIDIHIGSIQPGVGFFVDSTHLIALTNYLYQGVKYAYIHYRNGGGDTGGNQQNWTVAGWGALSSMQLKFSRTGNSFSFWMRPLTGGEWILIETRTLALASTGKILLHAYSGGAVAGGYCEFDNLVFDVETGPEVPYSTSVFTIEDADAQTINAGTLQAFDKATFGVTTTNSPTLSFRTSDQDADGAPSWSSSKTLAQLQAEANTEKQYMAIEVTASKNGLSYKFDQLSVGTYNLDVTPPGIPAIDWVMSLTAGVGFAAKITEPEDVDYSHCQVEVKANNGSWQKIDASFGLGGTDYMKFASATTDPQPAGQINSASFARWGYQAGDVITIRVRSVDGSGNTSAWVTSESLTLEITYPQPTVISVSPLYCSSTGGTDITITGTNFRNGCSVTLDGVACTSVVVVSSTRITCKTPSAQIGHQTLRVTNSDNKTDAITYQIGEANYVPVFTEGTVVSWPEDTSTVVWE